MLLDATAIEVRENPAPNPSRPLRWGADCIAGRRGEASRADEPAGAAVLRNHDGAEMLAELPRNAMSAANSTAEETSTAGLATNSIWTWPMDRFRSVAC